jgi:hypothetical protein
MNDERFDELMRDAAHTYNRPPEVPPLEAMWDVIEQRRQNSPRLVEDGRIRDPFLSRKNRPWLRQPWLRMAAMLVLGLILGRASVALVSEPEPEVIPPPTGEAVARPYQSITINYLGETAALLVDLPTELEGERTDSLFIDRADDLLLRTRLLLESPATADPALRALLEDVEVVLVQVVRLPEKNDPTRTELLREALEQNNVMPRIRNAVVDHIAD